MGQSSVAAAGNARRQARWRERREARWAAMVAECEPLRGQVAALEAAVARLQAEGAALRAEVAWWQADAADWEQSYDQAAREVLRLRGVPVPPGAQQEP